MAKRLNMDLKQHTPAEALWLWRRTSGYPFVRAARLLKVGADLYSKMENGHHDLTPSAQAVLATNPPVDLTETGFDLLLARRRFGKGLRGTARLLKVSHMTLLTWEEQRDPRLVQFWRDRGFNVKLRRDRIGT